MGTVVLIPADAAGLMLKAHVQGYTRKDGTYVKEHDDKRAAAKKKVGAAPKMAATADAPRYGVGITRHGHIAVHKDSGAGFKVHSGSIPDGEKARQYAARLNAVSEHGRHPEMERAASEALKKTGLDPNEEFPQTAVWAVRDGLEHAFNAGLNGTKAPSAAREKALHGAALAHTPFETLETRNSDRLDFSEVHPSSMVEAARHAFAEGHRLHVASKGKAKGA